MDNGKFGRLQNFQQKVSDMLQHNPAWNCQVISIRAYKIKNELRSIFKEIKNDYIDSERFSRIAYNHGIPKEKRDMVLEHLRTLGIFLCYKDIPDCNMLVMNPEWIANAIYRIIN